MRKNLLLPLFTLLCLFILSLLIGSSPERKVFRVGDGKIITFAEMIAEIRQANVVIVGEMHDSEKNHQDQLEVIRSIDESGTPMAIGLEMFRSDSQHALDQWVSRETTAEQFIPVYYNNWAMPWNLYSGIFDYARERAIPMIGLNIPDQISRKIAEQGFSSLTEGEKEELPPGITCNVDKTYMDFIKKAYAGHSMHSDSTFVNFCEAQMVWDKAMAWHLTEYLKQNSTLR